MPRLTINFQNTIMYKIVCSDLNITDLYVGSTTNFTKRKNAHKSTCYNEARPEYNYKVYRFIRENGGWGNWSMVEIEKFSCNDPNEAHTRERYWIETLNATLNCQVPSRSQGEWNRQNYEQNKEAKSAYAKKYHLATREHRYEQFVCPCGGHYSFSSRSTHFKNLMHLTHIENPDLVLTRISTRTVCPCGGYYCTPKNKLKHYNTKKHLEYLDTIDPLV